MVFAISLHLEAQDPRRSGPGPREEKNFQRMDSDKDGKISLEEWIKHHNEMFKEIDTDGDSFLTQEELRAHHEARQSEYRSPGDRR